MITTSSYYAINLIILEIPFLRVQLFMSGCKLACLYFFASWRWKRFLCLRVYKSRRTLAWVLSVCRLTCNFLECHWLLISIEYILIWSWVIIYNFKIYFWRIIFVLAVRCVLFVWILFKSKCIIGVASIIWELLLLIGRSKYELLFHLLSILVNMSDILSLFLISLFSKLDICNTIYWLSILIVCNLSARLLSLFSGWWELWKAWKIISTSIQVISLYLFFSSDWRMKTVHLAFSLI